MCVCTWSFNIWTNLAVHLQLLKGEKYSKIPFTWLAWHPTGAKLSNILDYQLVPTLTKVLIGNFLLLPLHLVCTTKQRCIPCGHLISICWFQVLFSVFPSLHSWWSRRQGVRRYHIWCTDTLRGLFEHGPKICLFHWWSFYLVKSKSK